MVANLGDRPAVILEGTPLGTAEKLPRACGQLDNTSSITGEPAIPNADLDHLKPMVDGLPAELSPAERKRAEEFICSRAAAFSKNAYDMGRTKVLQHTIDTGNNRPVREPLRRHLQAHLDFIDNEIERLLKMDIIEPSASPWSSNIVLVKKKNGQLRTCIDYRRVNALTYKDAYPIPKIDSCLDALGGSTYFSRLDLRTSYWQVEILPEDRDKMAFVSRLGQHRLKDFPFVLCNAVGLFNAIKTESSLA